jgi:hypothetical protein
VKKVAFLKKGPKLGSGQREYPDLAGSGSSDWNRDGGCAGM